jgi:hypothetical protein
MERRVKTSHYGPISGIPRQETWDHAFDDNFFDRFFVGYTLTQMLKPLKKSENQYAWIWKDKPPVTDMPSDEDYARAEKRVEKRGLSEDQIEVLARQEMENRKKLWKIKQQERRAKDPNYKQRKSPKPKKAQPPLEMIWPGDLKIIRELVRDGKTYFLRYKEQLQYKDIKGLEI